MRNLSNKHSQYQQWFLFFILIHLIVWTLAPAMVRYNLPMDSLEGSVWGHQLALGYDKNPFLNAWLTALAMHIKPGADWLIYLFSQLSVVACFWAVWRLAKEIVPEANALAAVMILECVQYYTVHSIDFNDNNLELSTWALTAYFCYRACKHNRTRDWLLTGVFAALGMMAKYYTLALLAGISVYLIADPDARRTLTTLPPYLGLGLFALIIAPHFIWLTSHDYVTVTYIFERTNSTPSWWNHLTYPLQFAWQQLICFVPAVLLYVIFYRLNRHDRFRAYFVTAENDKLFLIAAGILPFLFTILLALGFGIRLHAGWGTPLLSLWGILLAVYLPISFSDRLIKQFIAVIYIIMALLIAGYSFTLTRPNNTSSANYPGNDIANTITQYWHAHYQTPLAYIAGPRFIAGNVQYHSPDHPSVYMEWDNRRSFWINENDMQNRGAVFIWNADQVGLYTELKHRFPRLSPPIPLSFAWHRQTSGKNIAIQFAILPPTTKSVTP